MRQVLDVAHAQQPRQTLDDLLLTTTQTLAGRPRDVLKGRDFFFLLRTALKDSP